MCDLKHNERGFTLIEVLLSIILLFIIMTSFMGFFTQSTIFNKKNEQKLDYTQTAQTVINLVEENITRSELEKDNDIKTIFSSPFTPKSIDKTALEKFFSKKSSTPFIQNNPNQILATFSYINETGLIQVKVMVADPSNPNHKSETYTYIRK
ncbi:MULTISPECIES: prepilin-type N-terminal cleavage/methylation domain-containing protein [unclassified Bacillus (in: firmicutes)]|uniref:prepilin-type N-terminal cleavage/methylation domain-containing protein n=1 Tax=unclassified Bacillus (in: firmicutes) TaxID=185979 RepID=UPI0008E57882|nr:MULTISPECIES: prepilin-type N-terminal cleavage/methylation domain-containing protein [unclassified Bacillus (in: firmicutes)]SFB16357.1 prepilin-type N-terminal cleavage/methylation domain-containing protein [Bacillus sp. UNCCL13]SFQ78104.1 prepilin-type N-terminal cleavage/methylation domain-containing protein [Bacillus sp. cl95]